MIDESTGKSKRTYYIVIAFTLAFVGIFICAGLFVKAEYGSGAPARPTTGGAKPPPAASIAGHYVGYTTISTGICSVGAHEMDVDIDEEGNAKSSYAMKPDKLMGGRVNPDGRIRMNFRDGAYAVSFDGEVKPGHIAGHTSVSGDRTCDISWELTRN